MRKSTKIWLIIAVSLILVGGIIFGGVFSMLKWDFKKLSTSKYETNNYEINESFSAISINTTTANIAFVASEDSKCYVECYEQNNVKHMVAVIDGALSVNIVDSRKWYEYIGINFSKPKITVKIPQGEYGALTIKSSTGDIVLPEVFRFKSIDLSVSTGDVTSSASALENIKIKATTGDILIKNASASSINLIVSTGKITASDLNCEGDFTATVSTGKANLSSVACKNLTSNGDTGDILLDNVIASERFLIERSTGDVKLNGCDAGEIYIETSTGDVTGTLLSEKIFITNTDTGKRDVPNSFSGGKCEITTSTGDIKIQIKR